MKNHRLLIALIVLAIWLAINAAMGRMILEDGVSVTGFLSRGIYPAFVVAVLFLFATVWLFGWNDIGLNAPFAARSLVPLWLPFAVVVLIITTAFVIGPPPRQAIVFILINTFLVGLSEELMFRGILFEGLRSKLPIWPAIVLTSMLFGSIHLLNALWLGSVELAVLQTFAACCTGMLLMAIRIRTKSLDPAILFHAGWDFGLAMLSSTPQLKDAARPEVNTSAIAVVGVFALVVLSYSLFLLRKVGRTGQA
jgi:membrane protease YdiL (CAAX protease family)